MAGYVLIHAPCYACGLPMSANPKWVPSHDGQPVCRACMEQINRVRKANGIDPHPIHPLAYEPLPEGEL